MGQPLLDWVSLFLLIVACVGVVVLLLRKSAGGPVGTIEPLRQDIERLERLTRTEADQTRARFGETSEIMTMRLSQFERANVDAHNRLVGANDEKAEKLREQVAAGLEKVRSENQTKLDEIRRTVDEQLQTTLEKGLQDRFALIGEHLQKVSTTLVEMQQLASGVSELKRVLSHVRPRGVWGEVQLEALLSDFLAPGQFKRNAKPDPLSDRVVEFAVALPGMSGSSGEVLLPIDAKFPRDDFERLIAAADAADAAEVKRAGESLAKAVKASAKEIRDKYINPPRTTDYAIMFLPSEGLYAEIARQDGLIDSIVKECAVMVAGPSTLAALLNALRMGFRSLAIQERAGEIANVLQTVRLEFERYDKAVASALKGATGTVNALGRLQTRQRVMGRALKGVELLGQGESAADIANQLIQLQTTELEKDMDLAEDEGNETSAS